MPVGKKGRRPEVMEEKLFPGAGVSVTTGTPRAAAIARKISGNFFSAVRREPDLIVCV